MERSKWLVVAAATALLLPGLAAAQTVSTFTTAVVAPAAVALDGTGAKYVADYGDGRVLRFASDGTMSVVATLTPLAGIAVASNGVVYVSEILHNQITRITPDGTVSLLAGGTAGSADGTGAAAQFAAPSGLAIAFDGTLFVADSGNHRVRRINTFSAAVTTLAGSTEGYLDAVGTSAQFDTPMAVALDQAGLVYVADTGNSRIRKIAHDGTVSTLAGSGVPGFADGAGSTAQFASPQGIGVDPAGWVTVGDTGNSRIRQVAPDGTVSTLAGTGVPGITDGPAASAQFTAPWGIAVSGRGPVWVADFATSRIRKIASSDPAPTLSTISPTSGPAAGGTLVTITGTGFMAGATVAFGVVQATGVTVVDSSTITATTPAHGVATTGMAVRNPDGLLVSMAPAFSFYNQPASVGLSGLSQAFNGTPRPATVATTPQGLNVAVTYTGTGTTFYGPSPTAPTNGGTYTVSAVINDASYAGYAVGTLTVTLPPAVLVDLGGVGTSNIAVFRDSTGQWWVNGQSGPVAFGQTGDIPVVADYNGDGKADLAVYRPSTSEWIIQGQAPVVFGQSGDVPVPGDYNGAGKAQMAVFRPSTAEWIIQGQNFSTFWGQRGDIPVPADYTGVGVTDFAVFRPSNGTWYVMGGATLQWGMYGDVPVPADYTGAGHAQFAVYRPSTGWWYVANGPFAQWGAAGDIPVPLDVDGDGRTEFVVFRPSDGMWYAYNPTTTATNSLAWGEIGDVPVGMPPHLPVTPIPKTAGDFDHDGSADITVFRPSTGGWYTLDSTFAFQAVASVTLGQDGDIPVPGNYQNNGLQERAVYRPSTGEWLLEDGRTFTLGAPGDLPVPGDYDGDGIMDIAVFTPSSGLWSILSSASGFTSLATELWGASGDVAVPADYDGDGKTDLAVFTPATGQWTIRSSITGTTLLTVLWGMDGDIPFGGDFDGDGKADIGVYRPSTGFWYGLFSTAGWSVVNFQYLAWGAPGDIPVPGDYAGEGRTRPAIYRPSNGAWYVFDLVTIVGWGNSTDLPILGRK